MSEYTSVLSSRYASKEMCHLFSAQNRYQTWRKLWYFLAYAQHKLGVHFITQDQLDQLKANISAIDWHTVENNETEVMHDVMAHMEAYAKAAPLAAPIIHLGETSAFVTDNSDLIIIKNALILVVKKTILLINSLFRFATENKDIPTLGRTHLQPAQLTTIGKRATLWIQDIVQDLENMFRILKQLRARGVKGSIGTQASLLKLFDGDVQKVKELDRSVSNLCGFPKSYTLTGQTYPRKVDIEVSSCLASFGASIHKMATDLRLLASFGEVRESFGEKQIGSSAMPYKRNPVLSERLCSLSRFLMSLNVNCLNTMSVQWLERTLDDSANRRIVIPEMFLTVDSINDIALRVADSLSVDLQKNMYNIEAEIGAMCSENLIIKMVEKGFGRNEVHEKLRKVFCLMEVGRDVSFRSVLMAEEYFRPVLGVVDEILDPGSYVGLASLQVCESLMEFKDIVGRIACELEDLVDVNAEDV